MIVSTGVYLLLLLISAAGTALAIPLMARLGAIDHPNARSSHKHPTPRGGGIVFAVIIAAILIYAGSIAPSPHRSLAILGAVGLFLAAIGLLDDLRGLGATVRLLVQGLAALALLVFIPLDNLAAALQVPSSLMAVVGFFTLVWLANLYNFMDGIDGLAACQGILAGAGIFILHLTGSYGGDNAWLGLAIAAPLAGFLVFNFPPARIFMGDAGSVFLGFVFAGAALVESDASLLALCQWLILLAGFINDASVTLATRLARREPVYQAHRSHLYQRFTRWREDALSARGTAPATARSRAHRETLLCLMAGFTVFQFPVALLVGNSTLAPLPALVLVFGVYGALAILGGAGRDSTAGPGH